MTDDNQSALARLADTGERAEINPTTGEANPYELGTLVETGETLRVGFSEEWRANHREYRTGPYRVHHHIYNTTDAGTVHRVRVERIDLRGDS